MLLATDASSFAYGGVVLSGPATGQEFSDYWQNDEHRPIHLKEADALFKAIQCIGEKVENARLDVLTDNQAVIASWDKQGSKDPSLSSLIKCIFKYVFAHNIDLHLLYFASQSNTADGPSRRVDMAETSLTQESWIIVDALFGPHSLDLIATDEAGNPIRHLTRAPTPQSSRVNIVAQTIARHENPYVFPPFALILPVLNFLKESKVPRCTFIVPTFHPTPNWQPLLEKYSVATFLLGKQGKSGVLPFPSKSGYVVDKSGLKWDVRVYRLAFH